MRFRLRTLLLVTTLCCVYAAWVGYLRNKAAYHRRESARIAAELAVGASMETNDIETLVSNIASHSRSRVDALRFQVDLPNDPDLKKHCLAVNHQILARAYEQATLRPWKILDTRFSP
jgi:hypothetical protein